MSGAFVAVRSQFAPFKPALYVLALVTLALAAQLPTKSLSAQSSPRGTVRTDTLWAAALGTRKAVTVYLPPSYTTATAKRFPVLYYLHGLWGNERNWVDNGALATTLDSLMAAGAPEAIVVMPDGDDSWYTTWASLPDLPGCQRDSARAEPAANYCVPWPHYDDYLAVDVVDFIDQRYRTMAVRARRAIAGLSMGGYGAVTLALAYPERFVAAASHSGVLSTRLMPSDQPESARRANALPDFQRAAANLWTSQRRAFGADSISWWARDPLVMADRFAARVARGEVAWPALYLDVGVDDTWLRHNRDFAARLRSLRAPMAYRELSGGHTWTYWRTNSAFSLSSLLRVVTAP
ncbi:MAG: hypothetical protein IBJ03_17790 [Gemmatimonadaceae bacterium]|nr:hypothetical protein [Gemmatimonadaceae bacterium]